MKTLKLVACLTEYGMLIWLSAKYGIGAGLAGIAIILLEAIQAVATEWDEKEK